MMTRQEQPESLYAAAQRAGVARLARVARVARLARCVVVVIALVAAAVVATVGPVAVASAQLGMKDPEGIENVDVEEKLGNQLPLGLTFTNADGVDVPLSTYFKNDKRPAILAMVYYDCPVVCDVLLQRLAESLNGLDLTVGPDFEVLVFSFDPSETVEQARILRESYLAGYNREVTAETRAAWQFHVGDGASSRELANAVGFKYQKLANGEYSHPVALFVITPDGRVSRYVYGFEYPVRDVKLSLIEASEGRLARTIGDRVLAFCYMFDPNTGRYSLVAFRVMQIGGLITLILLSGLIAIMFISERYRRRVRAREGDDVPPGGAGGAGGGTGGSEGPTPLTS
jgi:protein SCO1/2